MVILHVSKNQPITGEFALFQRGSDTHCKITSFAVKASSSERRSTEAIMDSRISLAFILVSSLSFSCGFLLGGSDNTATVKFHKGSEFGFEKNPNVYAHLVIPPWNRPFKPGYCASWEWHTDKKYRDKRVAICKQYTEGTFCIFLSKRKRARF